MNLFYKRYFRKLIIPFFNRDWLKYLVPTLIFVFTTFSNIVEAQNFQQDINSASTIDPVTKTFILGEIDKYTPIIEERRDTDRINILEDDEFVVRKPTIVETVFTKPDEPQFIPRTQNINHYVKTGETLSQIADKYDLKIKTLLAANQDLENADALKIGDKLLIPFQDYDSTYADRLIAKKEAKLNRTTLTSSQKSRVSKSSGASLVVPNTGCIHPTAYRYVSRRLTSYHHGVDMVGPAGTPVYASCSGTITAASGGWSTGYGIHVRISQDNGDFAIYGHFSSMSDSIAVGQHVPAGTYLGGIGSTGKSTGNHLHFEIRRNGKYVDYGF